MLFVLLGNGDSCMFIISVTFKNARKGGTRMNIVEKKALVAIKSVVEARERSNSDFNRSAIFFHQPKRQKK